MAEKSTVSLNAQSPNSLTINVEDIPSSVLKRLIGEVQFEAKNDVSAYNRTHNRHNRGR